MPNGPASCSSATSCFVGVCPSLARPTAGNGSPRSARLIELKPRDRGARSWPDLSTEPLADLRLTRDYLEHLRKTMAEAATNLEPFDEAYARADWSRFAHLPLFKVANRMNAYNTYLLLEQQGASADKP